MPSPHGSSVVLFLYDALLPDVERFLSEQLCTTRNPDGTSTYTSDEGAKIELSIFFDFNALGIEEYLELIDRMRGHPRLSLEATLKSPPPGRTAMRKLIIDILKEFKGLAEDDFSAHLWNVHEIQSDYVPAAIPFFDSEAHKAWVKQRFPGL